MERRAFIQLSAYTALALTLPLAVSCSKPTDDPLAQPLFFSHIADVKTITNVGIAYRKMVKSEDDKAKLKQRLQQFLFQDDPGPVNQEVIKNALEAKVRNDFQTNETITVSGWVLSVTEARQCALFSILNA